MDLRLALHHLAAQHQLSPKAAADLDELAGINQEPAGLARTVPLGMAVLAAALVGLGIIFWIAANWESLGRAGRFTLLQSVVVLMCAGAIWRPAARVPLGLLALLAIGGLFAYFGQTYQSGADPWQLFAIWAALSLPLCLGVRHDAVWAPWALVVMTGITLWIEAHIGHAWRVRAEDWSVFLAGWSAALLLIFGLSPALARHTGAGLWALRVALTLAVFMVTTTAVAALFDSTVAPQYGLGLLMLGGAAAAFCTRALHDTFALSAVGFGLNILLVGGLVNLLSASLNNAIVLLGVGCCAAALLAATVRLILHLSRKYAPGAQA